MKDKYKFYTYKNEPFYDLAYTYLPQNKEAHIVDIGSGSGSFFDYGNLVNRFENTHAIEQAEHSLEQLSALGVKNIHNINIVEGLPFADNSIVYIHSSHLIEHLYHDDMYNFMVEIDRVLAKKGILVISAPTSYPDFYNDLSHVKPYHPAVFINYFCNNNHLSRTRKIITGRYIKKDLVFRYTPSSSRHFYHSEYQVINFLLRVKNKMLSLLKTKTFVRSGFTMVLEKQS